MKKLIIVLVFIIGFSVNAQEINWMSFEEAIEAQQSEPRKMMVDVYTDWCGPCKLLDKKTFHNKDVVEFVNKNYYAVKFNAEGNEIVKFKGEKYSNPNYDINRKGKRNSVHQLSRQLGVSGYPSILFFDENTNYLMPLVGFKNPTQLEVYLKFFKNNDYQNIKTKEEFQSYVENFNYEFKE